MQNVSKPRSISRSTLLKSAAIQRLFLERDHEKYLMSRAEKKQVQLRTLQVSAGWSPQERATRLRTANARQAWLLNSIKTLSNQ